MPGTVLVLGPDIALNEPSAPRKLQCTAGRLITNQQMDVPCQVLRRETELAEELGEAVGLLGRSERGAGSDEESWGHRRELHRQGGHFGDPRQASWRLAASASGVPLQ